MRVGEPYVVADAEEDERVAAEDLAAYRQTQIRAVVSCPLRKEEQLLLPGEDRRNLRKASRA